MSRIKIGLDARPEAANNCLPGLIMSWPLVTSSGESGISITSPAFLTNCLRTRTGESGMSMIPLTRTGESRMSMIPSEVRKPAMSCSLRNIPKDLQKSSSSDSSRSMLLLSSVDVPEKGLVTCVNGGEPPLVKSSVLRVRVL